jgi:transposase
MDKTTVVGVDLAKTVFQIAVSDTPGQVSRELRLPRAKFFEFFTDLPAVTIVMEACGSAHHWGRKLQALGHVVILLPPHLVRPYITGNKTDRTDAKGILEAYRNEGIHHVPIKTLEQQTLAAVHRFRSGWISARTAQVNGLRGLLREFGISIPVGIRKVLPEVRHLIEAADSEIPSDLRSTLSAACDEIEALGQLVKHADGDLKILGEQNPRVSKFLSVPGIGLVTGTAVPALVGDLKRFRTGRQLASYIGITPRERSSGTRRRLGSISKRGDSYLRTLFIHGARSVILHAKRAKNPDRLQTWVLALLKRTKHNVAAVALANRLVRIVWSVDKNDRPYMPAAPLA